MTTLPRDLDGILLHGGSTKLPIFPERLSKWFGVDKVITAAELLPAAQLPEVIDPELTALSMGACYAAVEDYSPIYVRRLPARVTLRNSDSGEEVAYEPYQRFVPYNFNPARPFYSKPLQQAEGPYAHYEISISDTDGVEAGRKAVDFSKARISRNDAKSTRLVIDNLSRIWVQSNDSHWLEVEHPPWQTEQQREILDFILEQQRKRSRQDTERVHDLLTQNPFGWQSGHA